VGIEFALMHQHDSALLWPMHETLQMIDFSLAIQRILGGQVN
jgi:hypothetical protein